MRRVVHHQDDAGDDLQHQAEGQHDAPDPHPVEVLGRRDHDRVVDQPDDGQPLVQPLFASRTSARNGRGEFRTCLVISFVSRAGSWFRRRIRDRNGRFSGAGPRRMRPDGVVVRAVAGAEPAAEVAGAVAERHAAEVRADAHLDQPFAGVVVQRAVLVGRVGASADVGVARVLGPDRSSGDRARCSAISSSVRWRMKTGLPRNLTVSCVPTATPIHRRGSSLQRLHVGGRVHLVDERPAAQCAKGVGIRRATSITFESGTMR
jgi:hypothetical protein